MQPETEDYTPGDLSTATAAAEEYFDEDFDYEAYAEGLDSEDWDTGRGRGRPAARCWPWSDAPTWASPPW